MERQRKSFDGRPERGRPSLRKKEDSQVGERRSSREFREREERPRRNFSRDRSEHPRRDYNDKDQRPRRAFGENSNSSRDYSENREDRPRRSFSQDRSDRPRRDYNDKGQRPRRAFGENSNSSRDYSENRGQRPRRSFSQDRPERPRRDFGDSSYASRDYRENREQRPRRDFEDNSHTSRDYRENREQRPRREYNNRDERPRRSFSADSPSRDYRERRDRPRRNEGFFEMHSSSNESNTGLIRLNKYISNSGICSRREADELIAAGVVMVNGEVVTEMGYKVTENDVVVYGGERLVNERKKYLLLNKPKGYITTLDDPQNRKTVMNLIHGACKERIYPVGRLDRNTSGLLLFTNDGDMTKKLTHPSFGARKIYHVELDKPVAKDHMEQLLQGVELEDGLSKADDVQYAGDGLDKKVVGIELHSGKNRIVRRMFESLGYDIYKLDRVFFAGLTKKDLPRGHYRFLTDREIDYLKMLKGN